MLGNLPSDIEWQTAGDRHKLALRFETGAIVHELYRSSPTSGR